MNDASDGISGRKSALCKTEAITDVACLRIEKPPICLEYTQNKGAEMNWGKQAGARLQGQEEQ